MKIMQLRSLFSFFRVLPRTAVGARARRRRSPAYDSVVRGRFLLVGATVALVVFLIHAFTRSPIPPANAVAGTATFTGTESTLTGDITAGRLVDQANSSYYIDPAASGNSLITAGAASVSGNLVLNAGATIGTTNMRPLTIGSTTTGPTTITSGNKLQLQAGGATTGSAGTGSIYFLDSSGSTRGRFDTTNRTAAATGGTITYTDSSGLNPRSSPPYSGGYTVHTFTSSSTFSPIFAITSVDYLIVAGGGGGGGGHNGNAGSAGGGGGAGGFRTGSTDVTVSDYTITIGNGGAGGTAAKGSVGGNSSAFGVTATGGGAGGRGYSDNNATEGSGGNGGSGGGQGGSTTTTSATYGTGTSGQGSNGGGNNTNSRAGNGGGGASVVGATSTGNDNPASGGNGSSSSISGTSTTYAGGGGGGAWSTGNGASGGSGGGGQGGTGSGGSGSSGTANTGGGGGGGGSSGNDSTGGNGGSGVVIIRYPSSYGYGTFNLSSTHTSSQDLAEYYVTGNKSIEAGDVVVVEKGENAKGVLMKATAPYDRNLIGVISTSPGVLMGSIDGEEKADKRMLALAGRVPVKIDPDSPAIAVGDFLTSSDKPGLATKATRPGYVVGHALESWSGQPTIEAFIQLTYYVGDIDERGDFRSLEVDTLKVNKALEVGGVNVMDRIRKLERELDVLKSAH